MPISSAAVKRFLIAVCLLMLCGSTEAADDCSVADVLVSSWVRMARSHSSILPTTQATRKELEFKTNDHVALKGYSYSPPSVENKAESETAAKHFILLLQGSASAAAQLAETASGLALAAKREVFVYEYRGYGSESTVHPTAAAIQADIDAIIDSLSERGRRGVVIGLSMGGIFAIQSLKRSRNADLRALVDSAPAKVPTVPFLLRCPRWMNPLDAATADVVQRLGVLYGADDGWSKDSAAKELMEKVKAGGGRVWMIEGGHVDLSFSGLALRLPIYVDFVQQRLP